MNDDLRPDFDEDEMCDNCVTPWKCNGPHLITYQITHFGDGTICCGQLHERSSEPLAQPILQTDHSEEESDHTSGGPKPE